MTEQIPWFVVVEEPPFRRRTFNVFQQFATHEEATQAALHIARTYTPPVFSMFRAPDRWIMRTGGDNLLVVLGGQQSNDGFTVYVGQQVR